MKPESPNKESREQLMAAQEKRIEELEKMNTAAEARFKVYESDWSNLFDQNKLLREENHRLQTGYENLRIQKGGFGFKMLLASGMGGFITALLLCFVYLKLKPKPDYVAVFDRFQTENLFEYELNLSNGDFNSVEASLQHCSEKQEFKAIEPEIHFTRKIISAAKRYCKPAR